MSTQTKIKLLDLLAGPKKTNKPIIICFNVELTQEMKQSDRPVIVFRDFRKKNEMALKKYEIKEVR